MEPTINAPEVAPSQPPKPVEPILPKKDSALTVILSVLLIVATAIAALLVYQNQKLVKRLKEYQPAQTVPSPTPTTDPTAGWKVYSDQKTGIEFKYPADWEISFGENKNMVISLTKIDKSQELVLYPGDVKEEAKYQINISLPPNFNSTIPDNAEKVTVGGLDGFRFTQGGGPASGLSTVVVIKAKDYRFSYWAMAHSETHNKYLGVFDQILTTFKFVDQNQESAKELVIAAAESYLDSVISQNKQALMSYLTISAAEKYKDASLPTGYKTYEILNEFHSTQEEADFYKQSSISLDVKLYKPNDAVGTRFQLIFIKENDLWKTNIWPPQL